MWEWSDKLKLGKAFVKRDLKILPLTDAEFEADFFLDEANSGGVGIILTQTHIAKTKKLRPRLEMMAAQGTSVDLDINDWSRILLALCGTRSKEVSFPKHQLRTATRIANQLSDALGIASPVLRP